MNCNPDFKQTLSTLVDHAVRTVLIGPISTIFISEGMSKTSQFLKIKKRIRSDSFIFLVLGLISTL